MRASGIEALDVFPCPVLRLFVVFLARQKGFEALVEPAVIHAFEKCVSTLEECRFREFAAMRIPVVAGNLFRLLAPTLHHIEDLRRPAMDELRAELNWHTGERIMHRPDTATDAVACFEHTHPHATSGECTGGSETGDACTDDENVATQLSAPSLILQMSRAQNVSRRGRPPSAAPRNA